MDVLTNFQELKERTKRSFKYELHKDVDKKIAGILFVKPDSFTKNEMLSKLDYFNNRSNEIVDFFWAGYQPEPLENLKVCATVDGRDWYFNPKIFEQLRQETQKMIKWEYTGNANLILFNAIKKEDEVELDFSDAICIDLLATKNNGWLNSIAELFESIFSASEKIDSKNPSKSLSIKLIGKIGKNSLIPILFGLLPKQLQTSVNKIYLYGTENIDN